MIEREEGQPDEVPTEEQLDVEAPNESAPGHNPDDHDGDHEPEPEAA
jgi:hypothetical protein